MVRIGPEPIGDRWDGAAIRPSRKTYMDPLHLCIALGPLAVYLLLLGGINLCGRPFVTTGARDSSALGVAVAGFIVAGPMELFLPESAARQFGAYVWLLLIVFYALCLTLVVLLMRPRLVIYNITADQLHPILAEVATRLDHQVRWAGDSLALPQLGVQLHVECNNVMRNAQLVASGPHQSYEGWQKLETALAATLRQSRSAPNPYGISLAVFGALMVCLITFFMVRDPQTVAEALEQMLRL